VLPGAGLRDNSPLAEAACEYGLADGVVQLVRACMEQVFALQVQPLVRREPLGPRERRRPAPERSAELVEPARKSGSSAASRQPASSSSSAGTSVSGT